MNRIATLFASAALLAGSLFAQAPIPGQDYPSPIPVPFVGATASTSDPLTCVPLFNPTSGTFTANPLGSPLNFRSDLGYYKYCSARNVWSQLGTAGGAVSATTLAASGATTLSSTLAVTGTTTPTGGVVQSTVSSPYTAFTTLNPPFNLAAPATVTDTIAEYWAQIFIPTNATLTGACLLNGATVTSDKHILFLANAAGTIIAHTSLTSVADSGASVYQCQAFTATAAVIGPGTYFVGTQPNGTTDTFYTYTTAGAPTLYGTGLTTAGSFGTLVNITPTTTFTTAEGPLMMVY